VRRPSSPITVRRVGENEPIAIVPASAFANRAPSVTLGPFTAQEVKMILGARLGAVLVKPGAVVRRRVQPLRRRIERDGETIVEQLAKRLTIDIDQISEPIALTELSRFKAEDFGYASTDELVDAWRSAHPRITTVRVVRFNVGDTRDLPRLLRRRGGRAGSENLDYTANPANALPGEGEAFSDLKE
jgi:hypothetical protein